MRGSDIITCIDRGQRSMWLLKSLLRQIYSCLCGRILQGACSKLKEGDSKAKQKPELTIQTAQQERNAFLELCSAGKGCLFVLFCVKSSLVLSHLLKGVPLGSFQPSTNKQQRVCVM